MAAGAVHDVGRPGGSQTSVLPDDLHRAQDDVDPIRGIGYGHSSVGAVIDTVAIQFVAVGKIEEGVAVGEG